MRATDASIVARVLAGDENAFALLVERHYDRCLRLATHITGERADAEDVVQETFLRAFRALSSYEERERFGAWLTRILVNQCRSVLARRHRAEPREPDWLWRGDLHDVEPGQERSELREDLRRALAQLPAEQREALVLRFAADLTYEEMAGTTGAGVSALKMRVRRACARLRTLLETSDVL